MDEKRILLITTGGTIAGKVFLEEKTLEDDFQALIDNARRRIRERWGINLNVEQKELKDSEDLAVNIDSSNINQDHWLMLTEMIKNEYDNYNGFIITHGTNTLSYTSAALAFSLVNLNKPVILTGSQVPYSYAGSDAQMNLDNALRVSVWPYKPIKGVIVVFGGKIIMGTRAKKQSDFNYDAFKAFSSRSIGEVGRIIQFREKALELNNSYYNANEMDFALVSKDLIIRNKFENKLLSLTEFPGMSPEIFYHAVDEIGVKGIILRSFGTGDPGQHLTAVFEYLKKNKVPIVVTTQLPNGNSNFLVNEPGKNLKDNKLAIPSYDMGIEAQTAKLSWLLGQKSSYEKISSEFVKNLKGEIEIFREYKQ